MLMTYSEIAIVILNEPGSNVEKIKMGNHNSPSTPPGKVRRSVPATAMLDDLQPTRAAELPISPDMVMSLQRTIGNQAVLRMLSGGQTSAAAPHHVRRQAAKTGAPA